MKKFLFSALCIGLLFALSGCRHRVTERPAVIIPKAVKDIDGNVYDGVQIGDQVWMASNLKTTHYADGTEIPSGDPDRHSSTHPYRYVPGGSSSHVGRSGYLYNWPAVMHGSSQSNESPSGVQGICPDGWHVPSNAEWKTMTRFVENNEEYMEYSGSVAKALAAGAGWDTCRIYLTPGHRLRDNDATGFAALPAGNYVFGNYNDLGYYAYFWTTMRNSENFGAGRAIGYDTKKADATECSLFYGLSVRCVKD